MSEGAVDTSQGDLGLNGGGGDATAQPTDSAATDWKASLPADLRASPLIERTKDLAGLAKQAVDLERMAVGTEKIAKPREGWTDEDRARFYNALGRPEKPDGYDLGDFAPPEGLPWDEGFQGSMLEKMHEAGLTNEQARSVIAAYAESVGGQWQDAQTAVAQAHEQGVAALRKEWGRAYEGKLEKAQRAFKSVAGEDYKALAGLQIEGGGTIGDDPRFVRLFAKIGEGMAEHGLPGGDSKTTVSATMTPSEADAEMRKLQNDPKFMDALRNQLNPEHKAALARWNGIIEMASKGSGA